MTPFANEPTDTRMMGIVHDALRRDLGRAVAALRSAPYPEGAQRAAIGEHVDWMMGFLHAHHHGEDAGLWPLVRDRCARAAALVDAMEADHARIAPLVDACATTARQYRTEASDEARLALLGALEQLGDVLLPHLQREEDEAMPLASVTVTAAEWHAIDQEYFIKPKSLAAAGFRGSLATGRARPGAQPGRGAPGAADPETRAPPRLRASLPTTGDGVLGAGGCPPRRRAPRRVRPAAALPRTIPRTGRVEVVVGAPVTAVWSVVADVTRVGEWSHECHRVEWLDDADEAAPGRRFRGTNKAGPWTWSRVNEVLVADEPGTFVWRTVPTALFPDSTEWRIQLEAVDAGTRITQSYEVVRAPAVLARLYAVLVPSHRDRSNSLAEDLRRLGEVAEKVDGSSRRPARPVQPS